MRIEAKIRKLKEQDKRIANLKIEDLVINVTEQKLLIDVSGQNIPIIFTSLEFRIFNFLAKNKERITSRDEIMNHIWGNRVHVVNRTVDAHIAHIRKKISSSRVRIETVFGSGYKLTTTKK